MHLLKASCNTIIDKAVLQEIIKVADEKSLQNQKDSKKRRNEDYIDIDSGK